MSYRTLVPSSRYKQKKTLEGLLAFNNLTQPHNQHNKHNTHPGPHPPHTQKQNTNKTHKTNSFQYTKPSRSPKNLVAPLYKLCVVSSCSF
eukprot:m.214630 g.214630  ORF g.214630 m.214630 type:complete len:90 (-) comp26190_c0_seq1:4011-4280(-)